MPKNLRLVFYSACQVLCAVVVTAWSMSVAAQTSGAEEAPITLMIFSGFSCPYCAQAKTQIDQLKKKYPNDVRVVFKHFPLSDTDEAMRPHLVAAAAAEQGKFWEAHDSFFEKQNAKSAAELNLLLASRGVNLAQANAVVEGGRAMSKVKQDMAEASALKVRATPTYFVDGMRLEGLQEIATLERLIEFRAKRPATTSATSAPTSGSATTPTK
jgi:protein-disulfide isomerase